MAAPRSKKVRGEKGKSSANLVTKLRKGDPVIVIAGGNSTKPKRAIKGQTGKILAVHPKNQRVVVEGVNFISRRKRAMTSQDTGGVIEKEGSIHISNVMFYSEELKRPVRIKSKRLEDGRKVRGYLNPETKEFEQIDI